MAEAIFLSADEVRELLTEAPLRAALAVGLKAITMEGADVPPRISVSTPNGIVGAMPGYVPGLGVAAKLISVFPGNRALGHHSHQGIVATFDASTGELTAIMDAAAVTAIRTAHTAALAADVLSRADSRVLAILGAGAQGREHLAAFANLRPWTDIRIASRSPAEARAVAALDPRARVTDTFEAAVTGADIVCCCTDASAPILDVRWIARGAHVGSVGRRNELPAELIPPTHPSPVFVEWTGAASYAPPAGAAELQHLSERAGDRGVLVELGAVLLGQHPGREANGDITVYKSTGHAVEDIAAASVVLNAVRGAGIGLRLTPSGSR